MNDTRWRIHQIHESGLVRTGEGLRFVNLALPAGAPLRYTNAQLDDYAGLARGAMRNRPPLRLNVRARFSHGADALTGTAGFGFWNDPFLMTELRMPALPQALWFFFASPPSDMALTLETPGWGWKAQAMDALHWRGAAALGLALPAIPALRVAGWRRRLWPWFARQLRIAEAALSTPMTEWHDYGLEWEKDVAVFRVDGSEVLRGPSPRGPLGLVVWIDNQYLIARPTGQVGYGLLPKVQAQWMEIGELRVDC